MFRNFDNHDVYFDLEGHPLHGAVQFNLKDGTTPADIFDSDRTPIANPQLMDVYGKTGQQVFVDSDVRAYFYRYVGEGPMASYIEENGIDLSDESAWALLYTVESAAIDERSITGESAIGISDMETLRSLDPTEVPEIYGSKIVCLQGYYEAGDCAPVWYVWDGNSMLADDNGSVVQPEGVLTGRWILVQPEGHCDSRHFGVFPQDSVDADVDHSTGITQLVSYCNARSLKPYFNGSQSYPYFIYNSLSLTSRNPIEVSEGTVFVDKGTGNRFYGDWEGNPYFYNSATTVNAVTVRHSWHFQACTDRTVNYVIDTDASPANITGKHVVFETNPANGVILNSCTVESTHMIDADISMYDMEVKQEWFSDTYNFSGLSIYGCDLRIDNFDSADLYVYLKNKQAEPDYGDIGERTLTGASLLSGCILENAQLSGVTIRGNCELHNVSGTVNVDGNGLAANFIDCWLTLSSVSTAASVVWRRGSLAGAKLTVIGAAAFEGVAFSSDVETVGASAMTVRNCQVANGVTLSSGDLDVYGSDVWGTVEAKSPASVLKGHVITNRFLGSGKFAISPTNMSGTEITPDVVMTSNFSDHNFFDDSQFDGVTHTVGAGTFMYRDNYGGCPVTESHSLQVIPYSLVRLQDGEDPRVIPAQSDNSIKLIEDWRHNLGDSSSDVKRQIWWCLKLNYSFTPGNNNMFVPKFFKASRMFRIMPTCSCWFQNGAYGVSANEFPMQPWLASVSCDSPTITRTGTFTMQQQVDTMYTNSDIDEKRSRLTVLLYSAINPSGWDPAPSATITWHIYS